MCLNWLQAIRVDVPFRFCPACRDGQVCSPGWCWWVTHPSSSKQGEDRLWSLLFFLGWWGHFLNGFLLQWQFWVWITPFMWYFQQFHQLWPPLPQRTRKLRAANGLTQLRVPRQERVAKQISPRLPLFLFSSLSDIYCNSWKAAFSWHSTFYLRCCAEQAIPQIKGKVCLRTILGLKWKLP